ncbi:uncharacterized protein LOC108745077 isoform X2 [Agrilus planipennis]|uniref:Uncharacterized protein LOC108745077 isoform X2 n=1 Tax=Agrilus planipennis TaxID=224129 RepID=A0A1W4XKK9_AGRPL|nr:uncharacterized protein LOC108745077 isoform X2 [Agrilus planipennis]
MALFHKLFFTRKKCDIKCNNNDISDNIFDFSSEQVRVVLFKECDYRGRKLLFDSQTIEKIEIPKGNKSGNNLKNETLYAEINSGYGFKLHKPYSDTRLLSEMIFGTVSMSHRGSSLKIHCLQSPSRMMFTQIFPSPKNISRNQKSTSNTNSSGFSTQSLDGSFHCDGSASACSSNSMSDNSVHSTCSDTVLICRRSSETTPLDVPNVSSYHSKSLSPGGTGDSGVSGFHNFQPSLSTEASSIPYNMINKDSNITFSCGSLYKKYLRSTSTSLENSSHSLNTCASAEEYHPKSHSRSNNKLGVALIVELTRGQEKKMEQFLLEHAALMESLIWSARQMTEIAYIRYQRFFSIMNQLTLKIKSWLVKFLSGPHLSSNMWLGLSSTVCDNMYSIQRESKNISFNLCDSQKTHVNSNLQSKCFCDTYDYSKKMQHSSRTFEFSVLNWTDFFKYDFNFNHTRNENRSKNKILAKQFLNDFCELLENVDVKDTKFFVSTLVTAVLTHHLGWVATVLPASSEEKKKIDDLQCSSNALWGQLADLYGAVGNPTKMSHTVISGTNKEHLMEKILNCLSYFVRCNDIERKTFLRKDVKLDNKEADRICIESSFIPKENYKKYKDHIKELEENNEEFFKKLESKKNFYLKTTVENIDNKICNNDVDNKRPNEINLSGTRNCFFEPQKPSKLVEKIKNLGIEAKSCGNSNEDQIEDKLLSSSEATEGFHKIFLQVSRSQTSSNEKSQSSSSNTLTPPRSGNSTTNHLDLSVSSSTASKLKEKSQLCPSTVSKSNSLKRTKTKAVIDASAFDCKDYQENSASPEQEVVFVLGDNEKLVGIKRELSARNLNKIETDTRNVKTGELPNKRFLNSAMEKEFLNNSVFQDADFIKNGNGNLKSSSSLESITKACKEETKKPLSESKDKDLSRSQSVPPEDKMIKKNKETKEQTNKCRYRYSGVKFNFYQYPQIVENYLRSKNIEMSHLPFAKDVTTLLDDYKFDFTTCESDDEEMETLQTPSNASDVVSFSELSNTPKQSCTKQIGSQKSKTILESDLPTKSHCIDLSKRDENIPRNVSTTLQDFQEVKSLKMQKFPGKTTENNIPESSINLMPSASGDCNVLFDQEETDSILSKEGKPDKVALNKNLEIIELPMPNSLVLSPLEKPVGYTSSLMRGVGENYISNMVLQGTSAPKIEWESMLKQDLILCTRHPLLDQPIDEAVAIVANTDTWDVQLLSSHTYIVDKGSSGVRVGMSQLVSNMLESLLQLWKQNASPEHNKNCKNSAFSLRHWLNFYWRLSFVAWNC